MKTLISLCSTLLLAAAPAVANVAVSSPANGTTVTSPVNFVASGTTTCAKGVVAMGIYVNNNLAYKVQAKSLNTNLTLSPGAYSTAVKEWDQCGGATSTPVKITVSSGTNQGSVAVSSPANNSTVTSPVTYAAKATSTCLKGVASMAISVGGKPTYSTIGSALNTQLSLPAGSQHTVVTESDNCGATASTSVDVTVQAAALPTVSSYATPSSIVAGSTATLSIQASNATQVVVSGTDGTQYTLSTTGGSQQVRPAATTTYTVRATNSGGTATASTTVTVGSVTGLQSISHVVFLLQENHSFDNYFGMLNPYRTANNMSVGADGKTYSVDGIDDKLAKISNQSDEGISYSPFKLATTCVEDMTAAWVESYGDVSRYDFTLNRRINMDGFVHTNEGYEKNCQAHSGVGCAGTFPDLTGRVAMGYYDQKFLNYYYYMASQFALSDRWFSALSSKSIPNRIAAFTGGTTRGLAFDPADDHLPQLQIPNIFTELSTANVSWKIYYTVTQGACLRSDDCIGGAPAKYPATDFSYLADSQKYLYENPTAASCVAPTQGSSVVGDSTNSFCVDPTHIAPLATYYTDLKNGTLPSFSFIESGYGVNDEHPGSGQSILTGQQETANLVSALMSSSSWMQSVFFMSFDEGGGAYDHVPPVPGHSNDFTDAMVGSTSVSSIPDISSIAVNADSYNPCVPAGGVATTNCDLVSSTYPGTHPNDAVAIQGFSAQLGFRLPNMVISPYVRKHYVSHVPMDHSAIIKFVENRFIGSSAHLTARDAAQPNLLDFFDFQNAPWAVPPTPPAPVSPASLGYDSCTPTKVGP